MAADMWCNVFAGTEIGVLKGVRIDETHRKSIDANNLFEADKSREICTMMWRDENEDELLLGLSNQCIKVYDTKHKVYSLCMQVKDGTGPICGLGVWNESVLTAVRSGHVHLWRDNKSEEIQIFALEKGNLCRMKQKEHEPKIIATGGKENELQLWDLEAPQKPCFVAKNVALDELRLRVPVWVSDIAFLPTTDKVAVCTRHSHVRIYDPSASKRPVMKMDGPKEESLICISSTRNSNQVVIGGGLGTMQLLDFRMNFRMVRMFKGNKGSVRQIVCHKKLPLVASVGLDRNIHLFNIKTGVLVNKVYLTSQLNCMVMRSESEEDYRARHEKMDSKNNDSSDEVEEEIEVVVPKKRKRKRVC